MASLRRFLDRLRPVGIPGRSTPAGVPGDRVTAAEAELAPVFAALADTRRQVDAIIAGAATEATERVATARRYAVALANRAAADTERIRTGTAERRRRLAAADTAGAARLARQVERSQERRLTERVPALADELADQVLTGLVPRDTR